MNWIPEAEAAKKVGRKPRTLRALVKSGQYPWDIPFTAPNGRGFQYSEKGIEKILDSFSSKLSKAS